MPCLAIGSSEKWYLCGVANKYVLSKKSTMDDTGTTAEATHPPGIIVEIVGIEKGDRGRCVRSTMCVGR